MPGVMRIVPVGNLGNQMLQLMLALSLAERCPGLEVVGYDLPAWNLRKPERPGQVRDPVPLEGHLIDLELVRFLVGIGVLREIELLGYGFRMENYLPREAYQRTFARSGNPPEGEWGDTLVINIRGAEVLGQGHPDMGPLPLAFYRQLIEVTGLRPLFMGQIGDDYYSRMLRRWFPDARFMPSRGPLADFETIRCAREIVVGVSTFSWLAAWLSDARTVHLPVLGIFNPRQRPDVDLLPWSDERYVFYEFPIRPWTATEHQVAQLTADHVSAPMEREAVRRSLVEARALTAGVMRWRRRQLLIRAVANRLGIGKRVRSVET
jgi:hypothetical protein